MCQESSYNPPSRKSAKVAPAPAVVDPCFDFVDAPKPSRKVSAIREESPKPSRKITERPAPRVRESC